MIDWQSFFITFLTLSGLSLYLFLHIPSLYFLDVYQDILRGGKMWWVRYGANDPSELDSTWSWRPSLACGQLRLPDPKWSEIPTQFLDVHLIETYFYLIKFANCILDLSSRMWMLSFLSLIWWLIQPEASLKGFVINFIYRATLQYVIKNNFQNCGFKTDGAAM